MPIKINGTNTTAQPSITGTDTDTGLVYGTNEVKIVTDATDRVTVDGSGNVGIGTTSPNAKLQVNSGDIYITARSGSTETGIFFRNPADNATYAKIGYTDTTGTLVLGTTNNYPTVFVSNDTERMRIDNSGNVGIGTSSPSMRLDVKGTVTAGAGNDEDLQQWNIGSDNVKSEIKYVDTSAERGMRFGTSTVHALSLQTSNTERVRIDWDGKTKFYRNTSTSGNFIIYGHSDSGSTNSLRFAFRADGGLANHSANNINLSDRNVKKDIAPATGTWDCLKEWEIVNYRYKDQADDADLNIGIIAQQVAESCPEIITVFQEAKEATDDQPAQEELIGIKEQQTLWMAIKSLQEAMTRIETLETQNASLEARLTALEGGTE